MAVMTNKNEMKCVLDFLNELKTNIHWDNTRIKYIDIAIEAVEEDKEKIYDQGFKDGIKYALNHTELD